MSYVEVELDPKEYNRSFIELLPTSIIIIYDIILVITDYYYYI